MTDETGASIEEPQAQAQDGDANAEADDQPEIDISKIPTEKLLSHPEVQKQLQSMKDKEAARIERTFQQRLARDEAAKARQADEARLEALIQGEDYDSIGRETADQRTRTKALSAAAKEVSAVMEDLIRGRPEFKDLGEDTFTDVYNSVKERGGTVIDLMADLSAERMSRQLTKQVDAAVAKMAEEMDARLAEYGVEKRTVAAEKGEGPSPSISRGKGSAAGQATDTELLEAYGRGEDVPQDKIKAILLERGIKL